MPDTVEVRRLDSRPGPWWDDLARECRSPWHSLAAAALQEEFGVEPVFLVAERGGSPVGGLSAYVAGSRKFRVLDPLFARSAYIPDGPMARGGDEGTKAGLLDALSSLLRESRAVAATLRIEMPGGLGAANLRGAGFEVEPFGVGVFELPASPDGIDGRIHSKSRNLVRKARREGIAVEPEADPGTLLTLLDRSFRRSGLEPRDHGYVRRVHALLDAEVLVARRRGKPVAGLMWDAFGGTGRYLYHGREDGDTTGASNLLLREMFVRAVGRGVRVFHAGDVALPGEADPRILGITHFKTRMGFEVRETLQGVRILRPVAAAVREAALKAWSRARTGA